MFKEDFGLKACTARVQRSRNLACASPNSSISRNIESLEVKSTSTAVETSRMVSFRIATGHTSSDTGQRIDIRRRHRHGIRKRLICPDQRGLFPKTQRMSDGIYPTG